MSIETNLANALDVTLTPVSKEVTVIEEPVVTTNNDQDEDYRLARKVLRNLIEKGNLAIDEINEIARQNESARGFEVMSTLIKTVTDTTKELYAIQKVTKDLKDEPKPDPRLKGEQGAINVEKAVFVGSAHELLDQFKQPKENN